MSSNLTRHLQAAFACNEAYGESNPTDGNDPRDYRDSAVSGFNSTDANQETSAPFESYSPTPPQDDLFDDFGLLPKSNTIANNQVFSKVDSNYQLPQQREKDCPVPTHLFFHNRIISSIPKSVLLSYITDEVGRKDNVGCLDGESDEESDKEYYGVDEDYNTDHQAIDEVVGPTTAVAGIENDANMEDSPMNYLLQRLDQNNKMVNLDAGPKLKALVDLLRLLRKYKLPISAFMELQEWAQSAAKNGHDFKREPQSRAVTFSDICIHLGLPDNEFRPTALKWLPDEKPVVMYLRDIRDGIFGLLSHSEICRGENISLPHPTDPYRAHPDQESPTVSELHHGSWWSESWQRKCPPFPGSRNILVPLICYSDGVATDVQGRLGVTPFNITLGIFNTQTRFHPEAWTTLFYHPDSECETAYHQKKKPRRTPSTRYRICIVSYTRDWSK